jgi:hypothetical protein
MRIQQWSPFYLTALASVAVGLGALSLGGQELFFDPPLDPSAPAAPAVPPGALGTSAVATAEFAAGQVPPAGPSRGGVTVFAQPHDIQAVAEARPAGSSGLITLHAQHPLLEGVDEETRKLHADDQAHEVTTKQLIEKFRSAESDDDRSDILEQLSQTIEAQFETRQQIRAKELQMLEERVNKLREHHNKREDAKAEIVKARVDQLVRDAEGLGWSGGSDHATFAPGESLLRPTTSQPGAITIRSRR